MWDCALARAGGREEACGAAGNGVWRKAGGRRELGLRARACVRRRAGGGMQGRREGRRLGRRVGGGVWDCARARANGKFCREPATDSTKHVVTNVNCNEPS